MCCSSKRVGLLCGRAAMAAISFGFLLAVVYGEHVKASYVGRTGPVRPEGNRTGTRRLLGIGEEATERMGEGCSRDMVVVYQGATAPLPNGIPTYTVQILNTCLSGCAVSGIHVSCGWFSSARLVNPRVFRRLGFDDCLVNDGAPLGPGESLSFEYANTFRYPLFVSSVSCD